MTFQSQSSGFFSVGPTAVVGDDTGLAWSTSSTPTQFFLDVIRP